MGLTLTASTGAKILISRRGDVFVARPADRSVEPQVCLGVDLFEVIAELAGLELDDSAQAAEALELADEAQRRLARDRRAAKAPRRGRSQGPSES